MLVNWRWLLGVALMGVVLLSHPGVAAKIDRFKDKEGNLHITNVGEEPVKRGGVVTPAPPAIPAPTAAPGPTVAPAPALPPPPPPEPLPPPGEPGEPPPVMEPEPTEPPAESPAPEAGTEEGQGQANQGAAVEHAQPAYPVPPRIPGQGGRARGVYGR